ncbi:hypothetical protein [Marinitenerispora sediminis]|uniref:Uncharacterized protein n=1 Tax=Marinitenerispora sediminis TaxID=1931232 RepID=A0A368TA85_9ACTN|nr:hypothetical protein [Marinitenerispora sediminis]RCV53393.1 hypothetical protein DEF28_10565 [Marinitenerispora sediminis]RCV58411.1 hypothetical protein DEF23_08805 [Marinitenerispora sediminis]RCV61808.1 hypothetical protein DEF24_03565 [Marinitenerispora sediminis]
MDIGVVFSSLAATAAFVYGPQTLDKVIKIKEHLNHLSHQVSHAISRGDQHAAVAEERADDTSQRLARVERTHSVVKAVRTRGSAQHTLRAHHLRAARAAGRQRNGPSA